MITEGTSKQAIDKILKLIEEVQGAAVKSERAEEKSEEVNLPQDDGKRDPGELYDLSQKAIRDQHIADVESARSAKEHKNVRSQLIQMLQGETEQIVSDLRERAKEAKEKLMPRLVEFLYNKEDSHEVQAAAQFAESCDGVCDATHMAHRIGYASQDYIGYGTSLEALKIELEKAAKRL